MFLTQPSRQRYDKKKPIFRVVTPSVNPAQVPSLNLSNGSYLPPVSTTAPIGGTGTFGSGSPIPNVPSPAQNLSNVNLPGPIPPLPNILSTPAPTAPTQQQPQQPAARFDTESVSPKPIRPEGRGDPAMRAIQQASSNALKDLELFYQDMDLTGTPNFDLLPGEMNIMTIRRLGLDATDLAELGYVQDPKTMKFVQKKNLESAPVPGSSLGAGEFYGYQYNPETGRSERVIMNEAESSFGDQLRWDPIKKKYRKIKDIQSSYGYLPDAKLPSKEERRRARAEIDRQERPRQQQAQQAQPQTQVASSNVSGSFNTATG